MGNPEKNPNKADPHSKLLFEDFSAMVKDMAEKRGAAVDDSSDFLTIVSVDKTSVRKDLFAVAIIEDCIGYVEATIDWMRENNTDGQTYCEKVTKRNKNAILRDLEEVLFVDDVPGDILEEIDYT